MQEIAVRAVHLDRIDAEPHCAPGGVDKGLAHALEALRIERARRQLAFLVRHVGRSFGLPAALGERNLLPAMPRLVARSLAAGMRQLHCHRDVRMLADRGENRLQRSFGGVVPQAEAAGRDTAGRFDMGRLDAEHRRARQRERVDMGEMPVIGFAVLGRILAHRRHHDAVGKRKVTQADRGKQGAHGGVLKMGLHRSGVLYLAACRRSNARKGEAPDRISGLDPARAVNVTSWSRRSSTRPRPDRRRLDVRFRGQSGLPLRPGECLLMTHS